MTDFKVGDRVRYVTDGDEGVVTGVSENWVTVDFEVDGLCPVISEEISLLLEPEPELKEVADRLDSLALGQPDSSPFEQSVHYHTNKIADLLIAKNKAYGDSALNPVRIFSKASRIEQLNVRIDDKISRIQRGTDFGDEDTVRDLIGYLVLRLIAEESE